MALTSAARCSGFDTGSEERKREVLCPTSNMHIEEALATQIDAFRMSLVGLSNVGVIGCYDAGRDGSILTWAHPYGR